MAPRQKTRANGSREGGDTFRVQITGNGNASAIGNGAVASIRMNAGPAGELLAWQKAMEKRIDALQNLPPADKTDLKETVAKITTEAAQGEKAEPGRIERLVNTLSAMAPDIFEVAVASLASPLAGLGLVVKKVGDRATVAAKK